jgi:hypothetical protein
MFFLHLLKWRYDFFLRFPYDPNKSNEERINQVIEWLSLPDEHRPAFITVNTTNPHRYIHTHPLYFLSLTHYLLSLWLIHFFWFVMKVYFSTVDSYGHQYGPDSFKMIVKCSNDETNSIFILITQTQSIVF